MPVPKRWALVTSRRQLSEHASFGIWHHLRFRAIGLGPPAGGCNIHRCIRYFSVNNRPPGRAVFSFRNWYRQYVQTACNRRRRTYNAHARMQNDDDCNYFAFFVARLLPPELVPSMAAFYATTLYSRYNQVLKGSMKHTWYLV